MDGYNIATVLKRLEAAASRLEDIVVFAEGAPLNDAGAPQRASSGGLVSPRSSSVTTIATGVPPLPRTASKSASPPAASPPAAQPAATAATSTTQNAAGGGDSAGLSALKAVQATELAEFVKQSAEIAEGVAKQAQAVEAAYSAMLDVVSAAAHSAKPAMEQFVQLMQPLNSAAAQADQLRDEFRKERELTNFLATVPAGIPALGWVTVEGKNQAAGYVQEMRDSAQFYANRVLKERKDAKPWVDSYTGFLEALRKAVAEHFIEGLQWNPNGSPVPIVSTNAGPAGGTVAGGAPPPPPPPPSVEQLTANLPESSAPSQGSNSSSSSSSSSGGGLSGVFAELSQGESIASGLKPVDKKALKSSKPPVPKSTKPKPAGAPASTATATTNVGAPKTGAKKLVPRIELVESTWYVEDLEEKHDVEITASMGQSVRIDNCSNCTIKILGKGAAFSLSRSKKVGLLAETMVASCDIVSSTDFGLQVTGTVPSLMIDQSAHGSIYLSPESIDMDIFTSQTMAINVNIPEDEPGAYREVPLGEQILHKINGFSVKSTVVKHG